jgi:hypothetical protein
MLSLEEILEKYMFLLLAGFAVRIRHPRRYALQRSRRFSVTSHDEQGLNLELIRDVVEIACVALCVIHLAAALLPMHFMSAMRLRREGMTVVRQQRREKGQCEGFDDNLGPVQFAGPWLSETT